MESGCGGLRPSWRPPDSERRGRRLGAVGDRGRRLGPPHAFLGEQVAGVGARGPWGPPWRRIPCCPLEVRRSWRLLSYDLRPDGSVLPGWAGDRALGVFFILFPLWRMESNQDNKDCRKRVEDSVCSPSSDVVLRGSHVSFGCICPGKPWRDIYLVVRLWAITVIGNWVAYRSSR